MFGFVSKTKIESGRNNVVETTWIVSRMCKYLSIKEAKISISIYQTRAQISNTGNLVGAASTPASIL